MATEHFAPRRQDADLTVTTALPAAAGDANSDSIDLNAVAPFFPNNIEFEIGAPALTAVQLPNTKTCTYKVQHKTDDGSFTDLYPTYYTVTGTGSAIAASTKRFVLPSDVNRYIRVVATTSAGSGDCSGSNFTLKLLT
jgi:hypothetical protein